MSFPNPFSATDGIIANGTFTANSTQVVANNITASTLTSNGISGNNITSQAILSITSDNARNAVVGRHTGTATGDDGTDTLRYGIMGALTKQAILR